jgi:hypothetical protein
MRCARSICSSSTRQNNESPPNKNEDQQEPDETDPNVEVNEANQVDNPHGSQYKSDQEGYPLDEYEEYMKAEDYNDEDKDIFNI